MTAKFSNEYKAKMARIARLPQLMEDAMMSHTKYMATMIIEEFQKGIRLNNFGLVKLQKATIEGKLRAGYSRPETPLYGLGDKSEHSYINMMRIRKLKHGFKVYPSHAKHHSSGMRLNDLFIVHEYGCTITTGAGVTIRIPPRPAFLKAYERVMLNLKKDKRETSRNVKKAMTEYINTAKTTSFNKMKDRDLKGHEDYEKND